MKTTDLIPSSDSLEKFDSQIKEDLDKLSKSDLEDNAMKEFNIDKDDYMDAQDIKPNFSKEQGDVIVGISSFAEIFENELKGRTEKQENGKRTFRQTGKSLVGDEFIKKARSLISNFANESMLIGKKGDKAFYMQFENAYFTLSDLIVEKRTHCPAHNATAVLKKIKDLFWNVGDIVMNTGGNMEAVFNNIQRKYEADMVKARKLGDER